MNCECGCGGISKTGRFMPGHNLRVYKLILQGEKNGFFGKHHTEENKKKCSHIGRKQSEEERKNRSKVQKLRRERERKDYNYRPYFCECGCGDICKLGNRFTTGHNRRGDRRNTRGSGWHHSEKDKNSISVGHKGFIYRKRPEDVTQEFFDSVVKKILKNGGKHPNKQELFTDLIVQDSVPKEYIYSGNGKIVIAGKNPDWFNVNGKKKVIEFFGEYYHGEKKTGRNKEQEEKLRIDHFRKYGFDCLVIWGSELKDFTLLKEKIKNFTYGGK